MDLDPQLPLRSRLWRILVGRARSPEDKSLFHHLSLIAFFAWVGLGADGLSSSCYGPEEAFLALGEHTYLSLFVALATVGTIFIIANSYSQIIELFPSGGGGYLVATKLLSPGLGALSGCALLVDYILTITISIASGADALFSFLPPEWQTVKMPVALIGVTLLTLLNMRGAKESVLPLVPIFLVFVVTHLFAIGYAVATHATDASAVGRAAAADVQSTYTAVGLFGLFKLVMTAYSMGAGTFTGIEAVSNGLQILREPRVQTAKRTMRYMAWSLSIVVLGLMVAYLLFDVRHTEHKTLNAVLFNSITRGWSEWGPWGGPLGNVFVWVTLFSETALLFIAAQAGFMDGPRVLANMALDGWMPKRFATLSDRFVTQNGILVMGVTGGAAMLLTGGNVRLLVVLYSINVFITFVLSQSGMVRHWWQVRTQDPTWRGKFIINGVGLLLCAGILISVTVLKFRQGGWVTILVTGGMLAAVFAIRRHYRYTGTLLKRLDGLIRVAETPPPAAPSSSAAAPAPAPAPPVLDPDAKTAVLLVNGFTGVGLHTLFSVIRLFGGMFKNFVFVSVGAIDAGVFKGADEIGALRTKVADDVQRYVKFMNQNGYHAEAISAIGVDIVDEATKLAPGIIDRYPQSVFFGGQLVFPVDSLIVRWLHNYTVFALQRKFYHRGIPFVILPIRV